MAYQVLKIMQLMKINVGEMANQRRNGGVMYQWLISVMKVISQWHVSMAQ
jgi:hypothetical protein